jgi:hypothetical protein
LCYKNVLKPALLAAGPRQHPHPSRHEKRPGPPGTAQAAEHLGISRGTLARYARDGLLKPTLTLPTGHLRWSLEDLRRQMRELREQDV